VTFRTLAIWEVLATLAPVMVRTRGLGALTFSLLAAAVACSSGGDNPGGAAGTSSSAPSTSGAGSGGQASMTPTTTGGSGGAVGSSTGGSTATTAGTGGEASTGGAVNTGGAAGAGGTPATSGDDTITRKASTYKFRHFPIQTGADGVWNGPETPSGEAVETSYDTVVLENAYLRVTVLPSYGGRVLSIVHKPTSRELLYQNPLGTPYLMKEGIFYYDYLVIMGGIFPSFPEPEHGKYWNQPYELEVVSESAQAITLRLSRKDDKDVAAGVPSKYDVGRTDVLVQVEVTLRAGSAALELSTKLTNTRASAIPNFEYWTVTTLAPGSTPGQTAIGADTRILAKMDKVHLLESSWSWFGTAEKRVEGEVFEWKNLSDFKNWADQGTAFANPQYAANWSGLANDQNGTNIVRVSENKVTPGLKLWTFGKQSLTADTTKADVWLRPTIEMWHGVTPEFWKRGTLAASEVRTWTDRYFATLGLHDITAASESGAMQLSASTMGSDKRLSVAASLVQPNQMIKAVFRVNGTVVGQQDVVAAAADATKASVSVASSMAPAGAAFEAELLSGDKSLLKGQITLN